MNLFDYYRIILMMIVKTRQADLEKVEALFAIDNHLYRNQPDDPLSARSALQICNLFAIKTRCLKDDGAQPSNAWLQDSTGMFGGFILTISEVSNLVYKNVIIASSADFENSPTNFGKGT
jgi:hypothetical protein